MLTVNIWITDHTGAHSVSAHPSAKVTTTSSTCHHTQGSLVSLSLSPRPISSQPPAHTLLTHGILWVFPALLTRSHNKYPFPQHITPGQRDTEVMLCVTLLRGLQCYPGIAIFKVLDIIITS